jgi:hypothetical protein
MKNPCSEKELFYRSLRLLLSDFLHLFPPKDKKVFSWKEIFIGVFILDAWR